MAKGISSFPAQGWPGGLTPPQGAAGVLTDGHGPVPHIPPHRAGVWGLSATRSPLPISPHILWGESAALPRGPVLSQLLPVVFPR